MVNIIDPNPLSKHHITELTLADIPCHKVQADISITGKELVGFFDNYPNLPGVLITREGQFHSLISRKKFFEHLSKPFGVEVYMKRSVEDILANLNTRPLIFPVSCEISQAVQQALSREPDDIYEPVIVESSETYCVVDMYTLLLYMTRTLDNANQIISKQFQIAHQLTNEMGYEDVFHSILEKTHGIIAFDDGLFLRMEADSWEVSFHEGSLPDDWVIEMIRLYGAKLASYFRSDNGQVTHIENFDFAYDQHGRPFQVRVSALIVPLHYSEFSLGAVVLFRLEQSPQTSRLADREDPAQDTQRVFIPFQKLDEILFANLESTFSSAIHNTQLISQIQNLAVTDTLTSILNRRGFYTEANLNIQLCKQKGDPLSVLVIDIDHFKTVNDTLGHAAGDEVIRAVVREIKSCLRESDLLGRYGGDEFIIQLPNASQSAAEKVAARIRQNITSMDFNSPKGSILVTASIGIGVFEQKKDNLDALIGKADKALLMAKRIGRNQTVVAYNTRFYNNGFLLHPTLITDHQNNSAKDSDRQAFAINGIDAAALDQTVDDLIEGYVHALELRDKETEGHTQRVAQITVELASRLGVNPANLVKIQRGALLHDIGKIAIPDDILLKPGPLDDNEWIIMRKHPVYAYDLLTNNTFLRSCLDIPYNHHERWDGQGYPRKLEKEQIPLSARIFSVVDVWDALISDRTYRPAWSREEARAYIAAQASKQFDPQIVAVFMDMIEEGKI
jgi:diguanylate cyclase (GGDEF)-like protein/putative nucleotidyltransferase with HDIG domain